MKLDFSRSAGALHRLVPILIFFGAISCLAQSPPAAAPATQPATAPATPPDQTQQPEGQVIFSRSTDEEGQTTTTAGSASSQSAGKSVSAPTATDAEREAVTFTDFDLDVHLRLLEHQIAVRALVTVRNRGESPLIHIPLQISSSLAWERIRIAGRDTPFTVATLNSDVDHTGQLHEAAVTLAQPLASGATLQLDATYSGTITQNAQRLLAIGTPEDVALHSDWDGIDVDFTALRGFGNVVWYPASSVPVILGDGARVFDEMGKHKLRLEGAHFSLRVAAEFPHGHAPTVALINGRATPLTVTESPAAGAEVLGVATASLDSVTLGFEAPSIFLALRTPQQAANTVLYARPADLPAVEDWSASASVVMPFLQGWLGEKPRSQLSILDLPEPEDAPFETGSLLVTAIRAATPEQLDGVLVHALAHAFLCTSASSPPAWLNEGVAHFMGTLWLERESGRQKAFESLESSRPALALAEPASPGESPGQPLAQAIAPVYYRTKAAYVFWMLRDLVGDPALSAALRAYEPANDANRGLGVSGGSSAFEKLIEQSGAAQHGSDSSSSQASEPGVAQQGGNSSSSQASEPGPRRDLSWFFADWVDADKGLPDIAVGTVFAAPTQAGYWLVTVNLSNTGYAAAEIPVTVRTADTTVTQRVLIRGRGTAAQRILIQGNPTEVQANDGTVPETQASVHIKSLSDEPDKSSSSQPTGPPQ
jgi:hypothetical protein